MNFIIRCPACSRKNKYSSRHADKYVADGAVTYSWECKHCKGDIDTEALRRGKS
jgi:hypothetical protein